MDETPLRRVCVLLEDAAAARSAIELSSRLAHALQRAMEVVYVESAPALQAAAWPLAQVLAPGAPGWTPLLPQDVERGFAAEAARVRALVARVAGREAVPWTMRVVRGALPQAAQALPPGADLVLLGAADGSRFVLPGARVAVARRHRVIGVVGDETPAGRAAREFAARMAEAVAGVVQALDPALAAMPGPGLDPGREAGPWPDTSVAGVASGWAAAQAWGRCDLLVLPRARFDPATWRRLGQPTLLVGTR